MLLYMDFHPIRNKTCELAGDVFGSVFEDLTNIGHVVTDTITNGGVLGSAIDVNGTATNFVNQGIDILTPFGYAISALFFIIALIELSVNEQFTTEHFIKFFAKFIIGIGFVMYSKKIVTELLSMNGAWPDLLKGIGLSNSEISSEVSSKIGSDSIGNLFITFCDKSGGGAWIIVMIFTMSFGTIMFLFAKAITMYVYILCITRFIELILRGVFFPVALALASDDGFRGAAGRYFKKYMALLAQGGALVVVGNLGATIIITIVNSVFSNFYGVVEEAEQLSFFFNMIGQMGIALAAGLAVCTVMGKTMGIVNDVFGV